MIVFVLNVIIQYVPLVLVLQQIAFYLVKQVVVFVDQIPLVQNAKMDIFMILLIINVLFVILVV